MNKNKYEFKLLLKEGGWILLGQIVSMLGSLVIVRVLTEYLEPYEYGRLILSMTIAGLINQVIMGGIGNGLNRYYAIAIEKGLLKEYLRNASKLLIYSNIVLVIVFVLLYMLGAIFKFSLDLNLLIFVLLYSVLSGFNSSLSSIQNAARQHSVVSLHSAMDSWMKIGMAILMIIIFGKNSLSVVMGYVISSFFVSMSQLLFLKRLYMRRNKVKIIAEKVDWTRKIISYSWPFSVWGIFTWAQQASDRWALDAFTSTFEVGKYAVAFQLGYTPIGLLTSLMMSLLGPILFKYSGDALDQERNDSVRVIAWKSMRVSVGVTLFGFVATLVLKDYLFGVLVADKYRSASVYLPWIVLAGGMFSAGQILSLKLMSEMRSNVLLVAKVVTAIVGVVFNIIGAWMYGVKGVVCALIIFSFSYFLWMVAHVRGWIMG